MSDRVAWIMLIEFVAIAYIVVTQTPLVRFYFTYDIKCVYIYLLLRRGDWILCAISTWQNHKINIYDDKISVGPDKNDFRLGKI